MEVKGQKVGFSEHLHTLRAFRVQRTKGPGNPINKLCLYKRRIEGTRSVTDTFRNLDVNICFGLF